MSSTVRNHVIGGRKRDPNTSDSLHSSHGVRGAELAGIHGGIIHDA